MNRSDSIKELATALAKAQAEMSGAKKDSENAAFKQGAKVSKYADLASVREASFPTLTKFGLSVVQFTIPSERNEMQVETTLLHSSGEWMSGIIAIPVDKNNAHGYGSALTYCRRFALAAAVGIAPEDDDGNAAAKAEPKPENRPLKEPPAAWPEEALAKQLSKAAPLIKAGTKTAAEIVTTLESRAPLTDEQKKAVLSIAIDAFIDDMNSADEPGGRG